VGMEQDEWHADVQNLDRQYLWRFWMW